MDDPNGKVIVRKKRGPRLAAPGSEIPLTTLGGRMRFVREACGESQSDVARVTEASREAVAFWEKGRFKPSADRLDRFIDRYRVSKAWLIEGEGPVPDLTQGGQNRLDDRSRLMNLTRIFEIDNTGRKTDRFWQLPLGLVTEQFRCKPGDLVLWYAHDDVPPVHRGEYLFIDTSQAIEPMGCWLVQAGGTLAVMRAEPVLDDGVLRVQFVYLNLTLAADKVKVVGRMIRRLTETV